MQKIIILLFWIGCTFTACVSPNPEVQKAAEEARIEKLLRSAAVEKATAEKLARKEAAAKINTEISTSSLIDRIEMTTIDTFKLLQSINCGQVLDLDRYIFSTDTINKYEESPKLKVLNKDLSGILRQTHCFSNFTSNENFNSYLFYYQNHESHFSGSFQLVTIHKVSNKIKGITLSLDYFNEQQDRSITTKMTGGFHFTRTITQNFRHIHGIGKVDSTSIQKEDYQILENGEIMLVQTY